MKGCNAYCIDIQSLFDSTPFMLPLLSLNEVPTSSPVSPHPSRLRMTLQDYLAHSCQKMATVNASLSIIIGKVDVSSPQSQINLDKLGKIMRSVTCQQEDFVGYRNPREVVLVLPHTSQIEANQIAQKITTQYGKECPKLQVMTLIATGLSSNELD